MTFAVPAAAAEPQHWTTIANAVAAEIASAEKMAAAGRAEEAKKAITRAYFDLFEDEQMEVAVRKTFGFKHAFNREKQFGDLRKLIVAGAPLEEVRQLAAALRKALADDGAALDKAGVPPELFEVNQ